MGNKNGPKLTAAQLAQLLEARKEGAKIKKRIYRQNLPQAKKAEIRKADRERKKAARKAAKKSPMSDHTSIRPLKSPLGKPERTDIPPPVHPRIR